MKKFSIVFFALALCLAASAQPADMGKVHEKMQAEKIAYITYELSLTPEEAQAFWPVYNQVQKEQMESFNSVREKQGALRQAVREGRPDSEVKPLLDAWVGARKAQKDALVEHRPEFVKILGEAKTAKLYLSEENFRNRQIRRIAGQNPEFNELFRQQEEKTASEWNNRRRQQKKNN